MDAELYSRQAAAALAARPGPKAGQGSREA